MRMKYLVRPLEIKAVDDEGHIEGYGSVFNVIDSYRDIVLPGAFEETIAKHKKDGTKPAMLWQHRTDLPVGVWNEFEEDDHGLALAGDFVLEVQQAKEAHALTKAGAVTGMSIGFTVPKGGEEYNEEHRVWNISKIDLWEVSIVTFPANKEAQISEVKHLIEGNHFPTEREFERYLKLDAGFSKAEARTVIKEGYKALIRPGADNTEIVAKINSMLERAK